MKTRRQKLRLVTVRKSQKQNKKLDAVFEYPDGHRRTISFGLKPYSDFTKHKDVTRKKRYLDRHSGMGEHWDQPDTPGALAKWVLWNKPTLKASITDFKKRFNL